MDQPATYLTANQVRARFAGITDMTLWRWLKDERLGFPQPRYINRRRYFLEAEIAAFERRSAPPPAKLETATPLPPFKETRARPPAAAITPTREVTQEFAPLGALEHATSPANEVGPETIYVIGFSEGGPLKIGRTNGDPGRRLADLQTGNPYRLQIFKTLPTGQGESLAFEQWLHQRFALRRCAGEWFAVSAAEASIALDELLEYRNRRRSKRATVNGGAETKKAPPARAGRADTESRHRDDGCVDGRRQKSPKNQQHSKAC